jgi:hypothetical protein
MCFLPNSRASIDQAPGPIIANEAESVANMIGIQGSAVRESTTQISMKLTSALATGVHRPIKMNTDKPAPISSGTAAETDASLLVVTAQQIRHAVISTRCVRSPRPGQPLAKFEKSRCRDMPPKRKVTYLLASRNGRKYELGVRLLGDIQRDRRILQLDDAAF